MEDCVFDFHSTIRIDGVSMKPCASYMSEDLVSRRSVVKNQIEVLEGQMEGMEEGVELDRARLDHVSMDTTQHVMKIIANSGYGAMSFSLYNSYSPRCGFSVTAAARYCLHLSISVINILGYSVSYRHTDSIMLCSVPRRDTPAYDASGCIIDVVCRDALHRMKPSLLVPQNLLEMLIRGE